MKIALDDELALLEYVDNGYVWSCVNMYICYEDDPQDHWSLYDGNDNDDDDEVSYVWSRIYM